jgi:hypothetical protein
MTRCIEIKEQLVGRCMCTGWGNFEGNAGYTHEGANIREKRASILGPIF